MHLQVLSSGSKGNSLLVRCGEMSLLVDAGLPSVELCARLERAGSSPRALDHIAVTHGHLDHARSAGILARRGAAEVHAVESLLAQPSLRRARRQRSLPVGPPQGLSDSRGNACAELRAVALPHDAHPTLAFRIDAQGTDGPRRAVVLTDMGRPDAEVARALAGAHVLVLEFNHDRALLANGPYPMALQRRIAGGAGHLSNAQSAQMLRWLAGPELHTLVLAHLSEANNRAELALECATRTLGELGLSHVQVLVASQSSLGPNLAV